MDFTSYKEGLKYLHTTYAIDDIVAETDSGSTFYKRPLPNMKWTEYTELLLLKLLRCDLVWD